MAIIFGLPMMAGPVAAQDSTENSPSTLNDALDRLAGVERQIDQLHVRQWTRQDRLLQAGQALATTRQSLGERRRRGEQGASVFDDALRRQSASLGDLQRSMEDERQALRDARDGARRAVATLAWSADRGADADPAVVIGLALLARHDRDQTLVSTNRIMRLEMEQSGVQTDIGDTAGQARYYSAFEEASLRQLEERQQALVDEIDALQKTYELQSGRIQGLNGQRDQLRELVAKLGPSGAGSGANPAPVLADKATVPAVPDEAGRGQAPAAQLETYATPTTEAGPRQLLWHASPVAVRSLAAGKVVFSGPFAGYRHLLIVSLGDDWRALYGNLTECPLKLGDAVSAGQTLGRYQAADGSRAEPFWLEIRRGVEAVPPADWPGLPADWRDRIFAPPAD